MGVPFLILLAVVFALFGVYGFVRGTKANLVMTVCIVGALLILSLFGDKVVQAVNFFNKAMRMFLDTQEPLISTEPSTLVPLVLIGAIVVGFFLGLLKVFKGKPSIGGLLLGLVNGYLFIAYMLAARMPQVAFLWLPIKIPGLTTVSLEAAVSVPPGNTPANQFAQWLQQVAAMACTPTAIIVFIVLFLFLVILLGNRSTRKG
jgi:small-conductance mechanosensitive channel